MTAQEFINQNQDILLSPITRAEFERLTDGTPLFCVTTSICNKPPMERAVKTAGYQMVVATTQYDGFITQFTTQIQTVGLTNGGYVKIESIDWGDIELGRTLLFRCKPLPLNDNRRNHQWAC